MKLRTTIQYLFVQQSKKLFFILLCYLASTNTNAQNHSFDFTQSNLNEALTTISNQLNVNIAFDAVKLKQIGISKIVEADNTETLLNQLLQNTPYTYIYQHQSYLIVRRKDKFASYSIFGLIADAETGERMPYANVMNVDNDMGVMSSVNGSFSLKKLNNPAHIKIHYMGYYPVDTVIYLNDSITELKFDIQKKSQMLGTVDIKSGRLQMLESVNEAGHISINPKSFSSLPNMGETDIFRTLQLLPGIAFSESSADLNIRGGSADQNLVLFDGFTLYNLDHFFGNFSSVNPNVVKDIQIYKGGFDSRYGERVSGIVDITGKSGNKSKTVINGGINLISTNLTAEIPIGKRFTIVGAMRQSYTNIYTSSLYNELLQNQLGEPRIPKMKQVQHIEPEFKFYDFNTKLSYNINNNEKVALSVYGGRDNLVFRNNGESQRYKVETTDKNNWQNYGVSLSWMRQWNESYFSNFQFSNSGYANSYNNITEVTKRSKPNNIVLLPEEVNVFNSVESNTLQDISINLRNTYLLNLQNQVDFGATMKYNRFEFYKNLNQSIEYNKLGNHSYLFSLFVQDKFRPETYITIKPGIRANYYSHTQKFYFEPRFSLSLMPTDNLTLKFATGRYFQYISKVTLDEKYGYNRDFWVLSDDKKHPVLDAVHYIVGASLSAGDFYLDIEGYYKSIKGIQLYVFVSPYLNNSQQTGGADPQMEDKPRAVFINGDGKSKGIDLLVKYEKPFYSSWLSYSLSNAVQSFRAINRGEDIPAPYDRLHEINFVNMASVNKWDFSLVYVYATGTPFIESSEIKRLQITRTYGRLPDYHRFDISANYTFDAGKMRFIFGASIINLFNYSNYYDRYVREFDFDNSSFTETTLVDAQDFTPNFYITIEL